MIIVVVIVADVAVVIVAGSVATLSPVLALFCGVMSRPTKCSIPTDICGPLDIDSQRRRRRRRRQALPSVIYAPELGSCMPDCSSA